MSENELSKIIVDASYQIHTKLGAGLFESVYEEVLNYELISRGLSIEHQKGIPVFWNEIKPE
ncbi:GxxExxY protein [Ekhidna sp.]|uniref:GxxExxY protein n=1 Tax=Ekhidna sp. TaxID=2608089 RepID=UPI003CCC19F4